MEEKERKWENVNFNFNKSSVYCLPMLGRNKCQFKNVKACFIGDKDFVVYSNHIFVLHRSFNSPEVLQYESQLEKHPEFVTSYCPDDDSTMFVFNVPNSLQSDYNLFLQSKYSKLSFEYKRHVICFHSPYTGKLNDYLFYKVMTRDKYLKKGLETRLNVTLSPDAELSSVLNMDIEVFQEWMKVPKIIPIQTDIITNLLYT